MDSSFRNPLFTSAWFHCKAGIVIGNSEAAWHLFHFMCLISVLCRRAQRASPERRASRTSITQTLPSVGLWVRGLRTKPGREFPSLHGEPNKQLQRKLRAHCMVSFSAVPGIVTLLWTFQYIFFLSSVFFLPITKLEHICSVYTSASQQLWAGWKYDKFELVGWGQHESHDNVPLDVLWGA